MRSWEIALLLSLLCAFVLIGCGVYSFSGSGLPSHIRTVAVPLFSNKSSEYGIKDDLTEGIIEALVSDGKLKVVRKERGKFIGNPLSLLIESREDGLYSGYTENYIPSLLSSEKDIPKGEILPFLPTSLREDHLFAIL